jgi:Ca-activated chloride channel family protein
MNVCLVLDRSTSMKGERMEMVKSNVTQLLRKLSPRDMLSIVVFSDRAEVVVPPTKAVNIDRLIERIRTVEAKGATEIYQGLETGINQLRQRTNSNTTRHLILLTDGHTYGDEERCLALAKDAAQEGIVIHAMGIGHEWNDSFLDELSSLSGGTTLFVSSRKDLAQFLEQKINAIGSVYGSSVRLDFNLEAEVELLYAIRLSPEVSPMPTRESITLGNLQHGKRQVILFEFLLPEVKEDMKVIRFADALLKMEIPTEHEFATFPLNFRRPVTFELGPELPPRDIVDAMAKLTLYRLQERARAEVDAGNIAEATKHLQYLATHLLAKGDRELAHTVLVEAEHIQQSHRFSKDGDKQIKYGTRALLLPSGLESSL